MNGLERCTEENKYKDWYFKLVSSRRDRTENKALYIKHHIIPKCLGGSKRKDNLIYFTNREHFVAHRLLSKFTTKKELKYAVFLMFSRHLGNGMVRANSRTYASLRAGYSEYSRVRTKERMDILVSSGRFISPFSNKEVHAKTMKSRVQNGTNIFITSNPMHNIDSVTKKVAKTSGKHHYYRTRVKYYFRFNDMDEWEELVIETNLEDALVQRQWSMATFFAAITKDRIPRSGPMAGVRLKRVYNED